VASLVCALLFSIVTSLKTFSFYRYFSLVIHASAKQKRGNFDAQAAQTGLATGLHYILAGVVD
jgi:hypothetical protein